MGIEEVSVVFSQLLQIFLNFVIYELEILESKKLGTLQVRSS